MIKHRFASHVIQTLLNVSTGTIAREVRRLLRGQLALELRSPKTQGVLPKVEENLSDKGQLRTLTQLILDFSEVRRINLPAHGSQR